MREDDLLKFRWIADPRISPDGARVAFTLVRIDAELDTRAEAAVPGAGEAGTVPPATPDGRPWWEGDPRFTGRFQRPGGE